MSDSLQGDGGFDGNVGDLDADRTRGLETIAREHDEADQAREALPQGTAVGRYMIVGKVGAGGGGMVYAAYDPELDRRVAVKLLRASEGEPSSLRSPGIGSVTKRTAAQTRLLREAQAMAKLSHPNVVSVFDVGMFGDRVFVAMELVEGGDLRGWLKAAPRSREEILRAFLDAGEGLAAAHDAGMVHRDFKPDNVLIGTDGRVRVTDFGLVRAATAPGGPMASLTSMAIATAIPTTTTITTTTATTTATPTPTPTPTATPTATATPPTTATTATRPTGTASASAITLTPSSTGPSSLSRLASSSASHGALQLTQVGAVMGTPAYMAPEQHDAADTDARTDQYSFCVALYEALYGARPFRGTLVELAAAKRAVRVTDVPAGAAVAPWMRRVLLKGLSAAPADRYPSMRDLLEALGDDPRTRRRRWAFAIAGSVAVVGLVAGSAAYASRAKPDRCGGAERMLEGTWDGATKERLRAAMKNTGVPGVDVQASTVERTLDGYASAWAKSRRDACEATRVREEQPENVMVLRLACLDSRLRELKAFVDTVSAGEKSVVMKAPQASAELSPLDACAKTTQLLSVAPMPTDPAAKEKLESAQKLLDEGRALQRLGKDERGAELAEQAMKLAGEAHYAPLEAAAIYQKGVSQSQSGAHKEAEQTLTTAFARSLAAGSDDTAVDTATAMARLENYWLARPAEGKRWTEIGHGALERLDKDDVRSAHLLQEDAWVYYQEGDGPRAVEAAEEAARIGERVYGTPSVKLASFLNALGGAYDRAGRYADSARTHERALEMTGGLLGKDHPNYAASLGNLGQVDVEQGEFARAEDRLAQAVDLYTRLRGPNHPNTAIVLASLGDAQAGQGRCKDARPLYERAVAINDAKFGEDYADTAHFLAGLGHCRAALGDRKGALATLERGFALLGKSEVDSQQMGEVRFELAKVLADGSAGSTPKDRARARTLADQAVKDYEKAGIAPRAEEVRQWVAALGT